ncbi:hypothetical protein [Lamprocystis purpurea]|uniref:hypothetical protein n=1 Tax=Lamprocystis purpurea TaxID=61598 RepID=UPI00037178EA|nr:hypothetical protein [Lamprocystis purpurea]
MSDNPLTHHEILTLVEPFSRSGRQLDLAASDRPERRLVFKPREYPPKTLFGPTLTETLVLENPRSDLYRLVRNMHIPSGETATLRIEGSDPANLVERLDRIATQVHFQVCRGVTIARSYRLIYNPSSVRGVPGQDNLVLNEAKADLGNIELTLDAGIGTRGPAEVHLTAKPEQVFAPPDDLLAVLGWSWRPLRPIKNGWRSLLRLPASEPKRTPALEQKLVQTVDHLALTLAEPPARFHQRFPVARWICVTRRLTGILVVVGLVAAGPLIMFMDLAPGSIWRFLAFHSPPFLMIGFFMVKELPLMRPPRIPSPPPATAWVPTRSN